MTALDTVLLGHGVGGRTDLPVPAWMVGYGAAAVLLVSFAALAAFWRRPRLAAAASGPVVAGGTPFSRVAVLVGRAVGLGLFVLVLASALFGVDESLDNLAPTAVYVTFWVGLTMLCGLVGDLYPLLDPFETIAGAADGDNGRRYRAGHWPAAAGLLVFVWLELVYADGARPRVLAVFLVVLSAVVIGGSFVYGRVVIEQANPFRVWFGVLGAMAPLGPDDRGRVRLRWPLVGLARASLPRGTVAVVAVALGSTAFDGLTRTTWYADLTGDLDEPVLSLAGTAALVLAVAVVAALYVGAMAVSAAMTSRTARSTRELAHAFVHSLVPIAFAYAAAHYLSLLVFEGQAFFALLSDPFGRGWDLFGTAGNRIDFTVVAPRTVSYLQVSSIVLGHVAGVVLAHDRALELFGGRDATRSQYPLLLVMVLFTVGGLALLLGG